MFLIMIFEELYRRHAHLANDDVTVDEGSAGQVAGRKQCRCLSLPKAAVSMVANEGVTDRSRPYPDCLCCYCIQMLLAPREDLTTIRDRSHANVVSGCLNNATSHTGFALACSYNGSRHVVAG